MVAFVAAPLGCRPEALPPPPCPEGMVFVAGGRHELGETDLQRHVSRYEGVIRRKSLAIEPFCVDRYPFPGLEGAPWPRDGMTHSMVGRLDERLRSQGRRLCTVSELLLAAAGPENRRYPWGAEPRAGLCANDADGAGPIGSYQDCRSSLGVHDFQVRSAWARLRPDMAAHLATYDAPWAPPHTNIGRVKDATYVLYGGTPNLLSYYAPNNFGVHAHPVGGTETYPDDSTRVCADPGEASSSAAWREFIAPYLADPRFASILPTE